MTAKKSGGTKRAPKKTTTKASNVVPFREDPPRGKPADEETPATGGHGQPGHNSAARDAALKAAHEETYDLEKQEEALMEKYIQPLRNRRAEIKQDLKTNFEIGAKQFNAWHGVYYFGREAESGQDWITLEVIKEQARICPVGGTLDLVEIAEKATKQREEKAKAEAEKKNKVENVEHSL